MTEEQTPIRCKGKDYYASDALPLTLGDLRKLESRGVDRNVLERMDTGEVSMEQLFQFYLLILQKIDPDITEEDVESIEITPEQVESVKAAQGEQLDHPS